MELDESRARSVWRMEGDRRSRRRSRAPVVAAARARRAAGFSHLTSQFAFRPACCPHIPRPCVFHLEAVLLTHALSAPQAAVDLVAGTTLIHGVRSVRSDALYL